MQFGKLFQRVVLQILYMRNEGADYDEVRTYIALDGTQSSFAVA